MVGFVSVNASSHVDNEAARLRKEGRCEEGDKRWAGGGA